MERKIFFSKNLSTYLFANQMSQFELADMLGITGQAVGKWIKDNRTPPRPTLNQLSAIMGLPADDLVEKDLTLVIIKNSGWIDKAAEPVSIAYEENALLARLRKHLEMVQEELKNLVEEGEKVLYSDK